MRPRGRVYIDLVEQEVDGGAAVPDAERGGLRNRTFRLGVQGGEAGQVRFVAESSFVNGDARWEDLWIELPLPLPAAARLTAGQFKTVSLENLTSSRVNVFMERGPLNDVLGISRTTNLALSANGERWTATAALSGANVNEAHPLDGELVAVSARATWSPKVAGLDAVHLGGWVRRRERDALDGLRYRARPNTNFGRRFIDTGAIGRTDTAVAVEGALVRGPFSLQGEAARLSVEPTTGGRDVHLDTAYAFASVWLTGERRDYRPDEGEFTRTKVRRPVTDGGFGAVEAAIRYDRADLSDAARLAASPRAGVYEGVTLALNWHLIDRLRVMADATRGEHDAPGAAYDATVDTLQARLQLDF